MYQRHLPFQPSGTWIARDKTSGKFVKTTAGSRPWGTAGKCVKTADGKWAKAEHLSSSQPLPPSLPLDADERHAAARALAADLAVQPGVSEQTRALLAFAGTYAGDDADKMMNLVKASRGRTVF